MPKYALLLLLLILLISAVPTGVAYAVCPDGTNGDDDIDCTTAPAPDGIVGLDLGNDDFFQDATVISDEVHGDGQADGTETVGNGGNDNIVIDGDVNTGVMGDNVSLNGGHDRIVINGTAYLVGGDGAGGDGGNDTIIIEGLTLSVAGDAVDGNGGDDTITINGFATEVLGDGALGNGGNDTIIINGWVEDVIGDDVWGVGGNDTIIINGMVLYDVCGDCAAVDGNDTVIIGALGLVFGDINGQGGFDRLIFNGLYQHQLDGLDPAGGQITVNGHLFTWLNFESLIGLLRDLIASGARVIYSSDTLVAVASDQDGGISVFAPHGRVAFVSFDALKGLDQGEAPLILSTPNSAGWYVSVASLGENPANPRSELFQVSVYNAAGSLAGQFTFSN